MGRSDCGAGSRLPPLEGMVAGLSPVTKLMAVSKWVRWRWLGLNACMFGSAMAMSRVSGEFQIFDPMGVIAQVSNPVYTGGLELVLANGVFDQYSCMGVDTLGTIFSLCVMFIFGVGTGLWWKDAQKSLMEPSFSPSVSGPRVKKNFRINSTVGSLSQYRLKEITTMTNCFGLEIGRGGQGIVYLATLPEGRGKAAVKRLQKKTGNIPVNGKLVNNSNKEVIEREFWAELKTISRLHHRNLVALLGFCVEEDDLFLVYEFMGKGSLSQHLHPRNQEDADETTLDWKARMRCAVEVAQGLEYLHSHANPSLVHRDIKSGNILFDDDMNAKIADFGLSKPVISGVDPTVSMRVRGTHGYVDPVYLRDGHPCDKNDVYSYGVVLLELITGRRAIQQKITLVQWCSDFLGTGEHVMRHLLPRMVDKRMRNLDISYDQLFEVVKIARHCIQERQQDRPTMKDVVAALYNAKCKDSSPTHCAELPSLYVPQQMPVNCHGRNGVSSFDGSSLDNLQTSNSHHFCSPSYDIKENSIRVKCTIAKIDIILRCKIWPTSKNFGMNKVEASMNGAVLWKKGLWFYNAKSHREFQCGDNIKVIAEWHVTLRTNYEGLPGDDPRRSQGPFCVEYLALKDKNGQPLVEYRGDKDPLPPVSSLTFADFVLVEYTSGFCHLHFRLLPDLS
uniref:Protein kinase domain-containing protein n=1 Tax=Physcomitrium patens TaxID=3218 RepID=A0A7I4CWA8_PHYPA